MFYLVYHVNAPILSRMALRMIGHLKITLTANIKTPFDFSYTSVSLREGRFVSQEFKIEDSNSYNNPELLSAKIYDRFCGPEGHDNPIKARLLLPLKNEPSGPVADPAEDRYNLILNLNQEEDVAWMVTVLYYLEEIEQTLHPLKDYEEYLQKKSRKKEHEKKEKEPKEPKEKDASNEVQKKQ